MSLLEQPRPASSSSYFTAGAAHRPRASRLLLRVHSAEGLRHVSSHGVYCKIYVGGTEMVRGSRHYRQSLGVGAQPVKSKAALSASASAHSLGNLLASPFDSSRGRRPQTPSSSASTSRSSADPSADPSTDPSTNPSAGAPRVRVLKTHVQKGKRPNPVWNDKFDIPVADATRDILSIRVKSARLLSTPSIGACAVSLRLVPGASVDRWVDLLDGRKPAGRIRLQLRLVDDPAADPSANPSALSASAPAAQHADGPGPADSWLSLPDEAGPGAVAAMPPLTPHKPPSHLVLRPRPQDPQDEDETPVRENGGSSTSNESEPAAEDPPPSPAQPQPQALLVSSMPGARGSRASSARRFRESRRRRESRRTGSPASPQPSTPPPPPSTSFRRGRPSTRDAADRGRPPVQDAMDQSAARDTGRRSEDNLSGLDYGRASEPSADSSPAATRESFHSFVHSAPATLVAPTKTKSAPDVKTVPDVEPPALGRSVLADRGTMTLDELAKSRMVAGPVRRPTGPRESSRLHFDSDEDDEDEYADARTTDAFGELLESPPPSPTPSASRSPTQSPSASRSPSASWSPPRSPPRSPRRSSAQVFEDDAEVVAAHQEKLRLTASLRGSMSGSELSTLSLMLTPSEVCGSESLGDTMDLSSDVDSASDSASDSDEDAVDGGEGPRIPLGASLAKLLSRFSANVLMEEEELEDDDDDDDDYCRAGSDEFVPIMDLAPLAPVDAIDDIDCA